MSGYGKLVKTDKNGTEYYEDWVCPRCGGKGGSDAWAYTGWTCYECGGSGLATKPTITKKYTEEYKAKLDAMRAKREAKRIADEIAKVAPMVAQYNAEFFEKQGFNAEGKTYVVLGNTFNIKDELKEAGARWSNLIGWHFPNQMAQYTTVEINVDDCFFKDYTGVYKWNNWKSNEDETYSEKINQANDDLKRSTCNSHHVGTVGGKVETKVTIQFVKMFEYKMNAWTTLTSWMYKMVDELGNVFIWKASNHQSFKEGDVVTVKGTIKEHSEYDGEPQTVLTRCKMQ